MGGTLSEPSGNVDAQGNFSIQVITNALSNIGIDLTVWSVKLSTSEPSLELGFIVNRNAHWFSIRKINNNWWDLNSAKETPEHISEFYLGAFLSQLSNDGYSVFVARGNFPQNSISDTQSGDRGAFWHLESVLLNPKSNSSTGKVVAVVEKFVGKGNKLGDTEGNSSSSGGSGDTGAASNNQEEDEDLAMAIALSVSEMKTEGPDMTEKEKIRAKRLAAMGR